MNHLVKLAYEICAAAHAGRVLHRLEQGIL